MCELVNHPLTSDYLCVTFEETSSHGLGALIVRGVKYVQFSLFRKFAPGHSRKTWIWHSQGFSLFSLVAFCNEHFESVEEFRNEKAGLGLRNCGLVGMVSTCWGVFCKRFIQIV